MSFLCEVIPDSPVSLCHQLINHLIPPLPCGRSCVILSYPVPCGVTCQSEDPLYIALDSYKRVSYIEVFRGSKGRKVLKAAPIIADVRVSARVEDKAVTKMVSG